MVTGQISSPMGINTRGITSRENQMELASTLGRTAVFTLVPSRRDLKMVRGNGGNLMNKCAIITKENTKMTRNADKVCFNGPLVIFTRASTEMMREMVMER